MDKAPTYGLATSELKAQGVSSQQQSPFTGHPPSPRSRPLAMRSLDSPDTKASTSPTQAQTDASSA